MESTGPSKTVPPTELSEPIVEWLVSEVGCQKRDYFRGYVFDCPIPDDTTGAVKSPDVVGVRFNRTDTEQPSFDFHFHVITVLDRVDEDAVHRSMGEVEELRSHLRGARIAADSLAFYILAPTADFGAGLESWAEENGVGILTLEGREVDRGFIDRLKPAAPIDVSELRMKYLSHGTDQSSRGNFRRAIERTAVLNELMDPSAFYEAEIQPEKDRVRGEKNWENAFESVSSRKAREALEELVAFLEALPDIVVRPHGGYSKNYPLFVDCDGEMVLKLEPQTDSFKVHNSDEQLLFRVHSNSEITYTIDGIESLAGVKEHLQEELNN